MDPTAGLSRGSSREAFRLRTGFFRLGEITAQTASVFNERVHLAWGDMAADDASPPASVRVGLKWSKCDQVGAGVDVYVGRTGTDVCPVTLTLQYVSERGHSAGAFYIRRNGTPLTKSFFVARVRQTLLSLGVDPQHYAGHSIRIGAATAAAQAGLEDSVIQALGRWYSSVPALHPYATWRVGGVFEADCDDRRQRIDLPQRAQVLVTTVRPGIG